MRELQKIVVPIDFSENTDRLIEFALTFLHKIPANLHLLHVVDFSMQWTMIESPHAEELKVEFKRSAKEKMTAICEDISLPQGQLFGKVVLGDPVTEILDYTRNLNADLIIISTHGHKGIINFKLGKVPKRVLKDAHCPVLIMNPFASES